MWNMLYEQECFQNRPIFSVICATFVMMRKKCCKLQILISHMAKTWNKYHSTAFSTLYYRTQVIKNLNSQGLEIQK